MRSIFIRLELLLIAAILVIASSCQTSAEIVSFSPLPDFIEEQDVILVPEPIIVDLSEADNTRSSVSDTDEIYIDDIKEDTNILEDDLGIADDTESESDSLLAKIVVLDPGHQRRGNAAQEPLGPGSTETKMRVSYGTVGTTTGVPEYELVLEVSLFLRDELMSRGYEVYLTRETHDVDISNRERAEMATELNADVFIRIHANGDENPEVSGILTISQTARNPYVPELYSESRALAETVLNEMIEVTGAKRIGVWETDSMSGINWAIMPTTIVELGFMTNPEEDRLMQTPEYQRKLVEGIANGIDLYFRTEDNLILEPTPMVAHAPLEVTNLDEYDSTLSAALDSVAIAYNSIAVSLAYYDGGSVIYTYQYGYANTNERSVVEVDTKFRVASLAKLTTAICAMALSDSGALDLDADISSYLGYEVRNRNFPDIPITCRMLLQHTSSLFDSSAFISSRSVDSSSSTRELLDAGTSYKRRSPGLQHEYSNFGYAVLGAVCEMVSGKPLDTLARELLFDPLDIDAAYVPMNLRDIEKIAALYNENHALVRSAQGQLSIVSTGELGRDHHLAQGNLTISAIDYAKILAMLTNGGAFKGFHVLSEAAVNAMHEVDVKAYTYMQGLGLRYSASLILGEDAYWHTGLNFGMQSQFVYCVNTGRAIVVITSGADTERDSNGMFKVCTVLAEHVWRQM